MPKLDKLNLSVVNHGRYNSSYNLISLECTDNEKAKIYYSYGEDFSLNNCFLYEPSLYYFNNKYIQGILVSSDRSISAVATCRGYVDSDIASISGGGLLSVDLNYQWRTITDSTINYNSAYYDAYESFSNYNIGSSRAIMRINISNYSNFTIKVMSDGEDDFDYLEVYELDSQSTVKATTKGSPKTWKTVTFNNIGAGSHSIQIVYKKDSIDDINRDRGFILVPKT